MRWFLFSCCLLLAALNAHGATERRVALLIGNAKYNSGPLTNPPNDVRQMEAALKKVGFTVQTVLDANQNQMRRALRDFGDRAQGAEVALMYYSGHGTQANGENYLIPIQANISKESDYAIEAVATNGLMQQITGARPKVAIVVLDACRDNPYAVATKSANKGLSRMEAPTGSMIAFATAPNTTAGDEGYYARELARQLTTPGVELYDVFRNTTAEVQRLSKGKQVPRVSEVSITDKIYLAGQAGAQSTIAQSRERVPIQAQIHPSSTQAYGSNAEDFLWNEVQVSEKAADYEIYLTEYPTGKYAAVAKLRIKRLQDAFATAVENERKEKEQEQTMAQQMEAVNDANEIAAIQAYLDRFPKGARAELARKKLADFRLVLSLVGKWQEVKPTDTGGTFTYVWTFDSRGAATTSFTYFSKGRFLDNDVGYVCKAVYQFSVSALTKTITTTNGINLGGDPSCGSMPLRSNSPTSIKITGNQLQFDSQIYDGKMFTRMQ